MRDLLKPGTHTPRGKIICATFKDGRAHYMIDAGNGGTILVPVEDVHKGRDSEFEELLRNMQSHGLGGGL